MANELSKQAQNQSTGSDQMLGLSKDPTKLSWSSDDLSRDPELMLHTEGKEI